MKKKEVKDLNAYFQYSKTGVIGQKIEENEVARNVTLEMEDGTFKSVGMSSFARWWKKLENYTPKGKADETVDVEESQEPEVIEEPEQEAVEVVEKPKKEKKPEKKSEKKPAKKAMKKSARPDNSETVSKITDFIVNTVESTKDCTVGELSSDTAKFRPLRVNGKQFCKLMWSKKNVRLYFRCDVSDFNDTVQKVNYGLPYLFIVEDFDKATQKTVKDMIKASVKFELDSMKKKQTKKTKEDK